AFLFGWNPGRAGGGGDPFAAMRFDPGRLAFAEPGEEAPPAPGRGPGREPRAPGWTERVGPAPTPGWESAAASASMRLFEDDLLVGRKEAVDRYYVVAAVAFAGAMGLPECAAPGGPPECATPLLFRLAALDLTLPEFSDKPPELPLLAVRAA